MIEPLRFALLGLGLGAMYALVAQGIVQVYRGSGVVNFAHGAIGIAGAFVFYDLRIEHDLPIAVAMVAGIATSALLGVLTYYAVMRPLRHASPLARIIATLGVLIVLQAGALLRYGSTAKFQPIFLPKGTWHITGELTITYDRLLLVAIAVVLTAGFWAFYRYSEFGLATSALSENQRATASLGWSPDVLAGINWAVGSALAGLAAILVAPVIQLQVDAMTSLVLAALAAALVAQFSSFPLTLVAGLAIGVAQSEMTRYVTTTGIGASVPFLVIIAILVIRGRSLPLRGFLLDRLPVLGSGRVRIVPLAIVVAATAALLVTLPTLWVDSFTTSMTRAIIILSIVVVTGYAGQASLCQFALAGLGAFIAGRLVATQGWPLEVALVVGVLAAVPIGALFALPAVRTRGVNLAVVTLGLGAAVEAIIFQSRKYTGGQSGTQIGETSFFGINIDAIAHPERYALFVLAFLVLASLSVCSLRRSRAGRRLIAVRTNERAAAAMGINVWGAKVYAFSLSSAIAALGGILIGFRSHSINYADFASFQSIVLVALSVIGGVGYVMGPLFASTLVAGGVGARIGAELLSNVDRYLPIVSGAVLLLVLLQNPNGMADQNVNIVRKAFPRLRRADRPSDDDSLPVPTHVVPMILEVRDLSVRFGGVRALDGVSATVRPGEVVGLIGPNGAGKTTFIDAVTGFVSTATGEIRLDGKPINTMSPSRRARAGLSRSWQSLELFEDLSVRDNMLTAAEERDTLAYVKNLVWPGAQPLPSAALAAVHAFDLAADLDRKASELSYGKRRLLAIARAVALQPSLLFLDEPAAGLGDVESAELATLVRRLADDWGIGILLIEHDMTFVMGLCDRLVVLDFGRMIGEGTPRQVANDPAVIAAYLGEAVDDVKPGETTMAEHAPAAG